MALSTRPRTVVFQVVLARTIMIATAVWIVFIGYSLLVTPAAIPVTVVLWLVAAITAALGARGKIEQGWGGFDASRLNR